MKIKTGRLFLALVLGLSTAAMVTGITGCATGPSSSKLDPGPTTRDDEHAQPVYTSPTVTPATTNRLNANTPP